ncbi:ester cyclase [Photobacterium alginatilyticum]|uniref:Ester cyclase n=1 Tax=Photobacterium alginatilyticum TaxID=1775171 RepID=A0ABW9YMX0_9GAMM|nr:ester cyclase [Photobacterium alginatilyticum]NBI55070.1 ester cyclase [Photobacterium alginatilyticum]
MNLTVTKYERVWIEGLNRGDVSVADEAFAPDCVIHIAGAPEPNLSVSAFKELVAGLLTAFPDLQITVEDQIIAGDKVATRWLAEGTNTGPLGDTPPTGKRAKFEGLILDRVVGEQVVERWEQWDQMGMLQQISVIQ